MGQPFRELYKEMSLFDDLPLEVDDVETKPTSTNIKPTTRPEEPVQPVVPTEDEYTLKGPVGPAIEDLWKGLTNQFKNNNKKKVIL